MAVTRLLPAALALLALARPTRAHADPPRLQARGTLRDGLRVEACDGAGCATWVRFPARPYRSFVEASVSPSGRFFYVWSTPDGAGRELDVFAVPAGHGARAERVGHWSPGYGGTLAWTPNDRLWQVWGCGAACDNATLYERNGAVVLNLGGRDVERSPDGRLALVADGNDGTRGALVDLVRGTARSFRGPAAMTYAWELRWRADGVSVLFERAGDDGAEVRRWVRVGRAP